MSIGSETGSPSTLPAAEVTRQFIHIASGLWAFTLPWLGQLPLLGLAMAAWAFNLWILPRIGGRWLWRDVEVAAGRAAGIAFYPLTVALLLLLFYPRPEVAAAGWGLLAFGDGVATLVGRRFARHRLPWNGRKTWEGSLSYFLVGWAAVWILVEWTVPDRYGVAFLGLAAAIVACFGALLESAPQGLDDNLTVPLITALLLVCVLDSAGGWPRLLEPVFVRGLLQGLGLNATLALVAYALATLDITGAVVGCLLGTAIFASLSWGGFLVLFTFFMSGSMATRVGLARKERLHVAQSRGGRRRAANAIANGGIAALCAVFAGITAHSMVFVFAFVCSLAAATADTLESEVGSVWGRPTFLITNLRPVDAGTDGGVSAVGTLAGVFGALLTSTVAWLAGLVPLAAVLPMAILALLATILESFAGATLERAGLLDNDGVNLLNTLLAALLGAALAIVMA